MKLKRRPCERKRRTEEEGKGKRSYITTTIKQSGVLSVQDTRSNGSGKMVEERGARSAPIHHV